MDYRFLLGKLFRWNGQLYVVSALEGCGDAPTARVLARIGDRSVTRRLPADYVVQHLVCEPPPAEVS